MTAIHNKTDWVLTLLNLSDSHKMDWGLITMIKDHLVNTNYPLVTTSNISMRCMQILTMFYELETIECAPAVVCFYILLFSSTIPDTNKPL